MKTKNQITTRQKEILSAIYQSLEVNGFPPSFEELKEKFNISSNQAIIDHLNSLEKKGLIDRAEGSARGITIKPLGFETINKAALIPQKGISYAGNFAETIQVTGEWHKVSDEVKINNNVFLIKISGDSMINAGINEGDYLLAQEQKEFVSGDIVVAQTAGGTTVKRFISQDSPPYLFLKPENPKYKVIYFTDEITLQAKIIGKYGQGDIKPLLQGRFL